MILLLDTHLLLWALMAPQRLSPGLRAALARTTSSVLTATMRCRMSDMLRLTPGQAVLSFWLTLTNWLSLAIALPEATASRARFTPSATLLATPEQ